MTLPLSRRFAPMEAELVDELPSGAEWRFEPKWDGFRCLVFRDGERVELLSKRGQPLQRYFPEIVAAVGALAAPQFVLDGELVVAVGAHLSFDDLLQRIHPAASRVAQLAATHPAQLIVFDLLVDAEGALRTGEPLTTRRRALEVFARQVLRRHATFQLSPITADLRQAQAWLRGSGDAIDGVIAKRADLPYASGARAMRKVKRRRTADCVVGGFRTASESKRVLGSLLLGLYDDAGLLHHVGFCSGFRRDDRAALLEQLLPLVEAPGFTGRAPGGPSRWSTARSAEWQPLRPQLVVEVEYDHFSSGRFRHGTRLLRWRPDKAPRQCTLAQVAQDSRLTPRRVLHAAAGGRAKARRAAAKS